jgi:hypothetical protein
VRGDSRRDERLLLAEGRAGDGGPGRGSTSEWVELSWSSKWPFLGGEVAGHRFGEGKRRGDAGGLLPLA